MPAKAWALATRCARMPLTVQTAGVPLQGKAASCDFAKRTDVNLFGLLWGVLPDSGCADADSRWVLRNLAGSTGTCLANAHVADWAGTYPQATASSTAVYLRTSLRRSSA